MRATSIISDGDGIVAVDFTELEDNNGVRSVRVGTEWTDDIEIGLKNGLVIIRYYNENGNRVDNVVGVKSDIPF